MKGLVSPLHIVKKSDTSNDVSWPRLKVNQRKWTNKSSIYPVFLSGALVVGQ